MQLITIILSMALACTTTAAPADAVKEFPTSRSIDTTSITKFARQSVPDAWNCPNKQGNFKISTNDAVGNLHAAPLSDGKTGSSYPHRFFNGYTTSNTLRPGVSAPYIKFGDGFCDRIPDADHFLLEYPVFPDGHQYNQDQKKPRADPGRSRVIYTYPDKVFCGIVAHPDGSKGDLFLCQN